MEIHDYGPCGKHDLIHCMYRQQRTRNGDGGEDNKYELTKDIESDTELEAGKTYTLSGGIHVKNGATLKIPAGVTIIAKHDDVVDYILIEQGAKIDAQGTASNPIVMTSEKKEPAHGAVSTSADTHTPMPKAERVARK